MKVSESARGIEEQNCMEFIAYVSHELRTPMASLLGHAEKMYDANQSLGERFKSIGQIRATINDAVALLDSLQHLAELQFGRAPLEVKRFNLAKELQPTLRELTAVAARERKKIDVRTGGAIPVTVLSDPTRLKQILRNVVNTCLSLMERGTLVITVDLDPNSHQLQFLFDGTFLALPLNDSSDLEKNVLANKLRTFRGNHAIALQLAGKLAGIVGGDLILVPSRLGRGSAFLLTIDPGSLEGVECTNRVDWGISSAHVEESLGSFTVPDFTGLRILVCEDDEDIAALLAHFLGRTNAKTDVATTGRAGLELAHNNRYDVILMDLEMPEFDGYSVTRQLRNEGNNVPILALTAHALSGVRKTCYEIGFTAFLTKPISAETLYQIILPYCKHRAMSSSQPPALQIS